MKQITNFNLVNQDNIIFDEHKQPYIINEMRINSESQTCYLVLIEIFDNFSSRTMTIPIACNKDLKFISLNNKTWEYMFFESEILKKEVSEYLLNSFKQPINSKKNNLCVPVIKIL